MSEEGGYDAKVEDWVRRVKKRKAEQEKKPGLAASFSPFSPFLALG
jgi:hypothetical protein